MPHKALNGRPIHIDAWLIGRPVSRPLRRRADTTIIISLQAARHKQLYRGRTAVLASVTRWVPASATAPRVLRSAEESSERPPDGAGEAVTAALALAAAARHNQQAPVSDRPSKQTTSKPAAPVTATGRLEQAAEARVVALQTAASAAAVVVAAAAFVAVASLYSVPRPP